MPGTIYGIRRGVGGAFGTTSDSVTATLLIEMDSATAGPLEVVNTVGVPAQGSYYYGLFPGDSNYSLILNSATAKQDPKAPRFWEVELTYESIPSNGGDSQTPSVDPSVPEHRDNPLARPAEWTQGFRLVRRVVDYGYDPDDLSSIDSTYAAITNSARTRFTDPPLEADFPIVTWTIVKNVSLAVKYYIETTSLLLGCLNQNEVQLGGINCQPGFLKMLPVSFRSMRERNLLFAQATFILEHDPQGWIRSVLDSGAWDASGRGPDGYQYVSGKAKNLDGNGSFLAPNATPVFLNFRTDIACDLSPLAPYWY